MLWLAIRFPDLPLERWTRSRRYQATTAEPAPLAVTERGRVCRADAAATARGVRPGQSAATAGALCAGLVLRERQPDDERTLLARLAHEALAFTPQVAIDGDDTLLLEVGGCLRLFGGLDALAAQALARFAAQGFDARAAAAETPGAARLFAGNGIDTRACFDDEGRADRARLRALLGALPAHGLGLDDKTEESVMQMGLTRFGEIDALPRAALGRRFGHAFTLWLDRVTGALPDPRPPIAPATFFVRELHFLDGIVHADGLAFPMQRLLDEFARFLRARQLATQHVVWRLTHVDGSTQEIPVTTSRPETSPAHLLALTRVHLERTRLPAPVETLRLACRRFAPLAANEAGDTLFPAHGADARRDEGVAALVDRLRARLGDAHCRQWLPVDAWRPETAQRSVSAGQALPAALPLMPSHLARRPLWLLREPALAGRGDGPLRWRGALSLLDGPERIDADWWSTPLARDYFVARHEDGTLYWVFHDLAGGDWYVHGVFG